MKFRNKKNKELVVYIGKAICKTNAYDGTKLVMYRLALPMSFQAEHEIYAREEKEFYEKFEEVTE